MTVLSWPFQQSARTLHLMTRLLIPSSFGFLGLVAGKTSGKIGHTRNVKGIKMACLLFKFSEQASSTPGLPRRKEHRSIYMKMDGGKLAHTELPNSPSQVSFVSLVSQALTDRRTGSAAFCEGKERISSSWCIVDRHFTEESNPGSWDLFLLALMSVIQKQESLRVPGGELLLEKPCWQALPSIQASVAAMCPSAHIWVLGSAKLSFLGGRSIVKNVNKLTFNHLSFMHQLCLGATSLCLWQKVGIKGRGLIYIFFQLFIFICWIFETASLVGELIVAFGRNKVFQWPLHFLH